MLTLHNLNVSLLVEQLDLQFFNTEDEIVYGSHVHVSVLVVVKSI